MSNNKIESWEKECLAKKRYDSYFFAEKVAQDRGKQADITLHVYRCQSCGYWHLTKQQQQKNRYKFLKIAN